MPFDDKAPCLDLDGFIADVQDVNKSIHCEDLKLAVDKIFSIKASPKDKHGQVHQNHSVNSRQKHPSLFFSCFTIMCIACGCLFSFPFIDMTLSICLDISLLHSLQSNFLVTCSVILRKIAMYTRFQETFSVTDLDFDECFLNNPLHKVMLQTSLNCEYCTDFDQPFYVKADSTSVTRDSLPIFQTVIFEEQGMELDVEHLQRLLMKNTQMVNSDTVSMSSSCPFIKNVEDFMKEDIAEQLRQKSKIHIQWKSLSYLSAHILRPVVPQPQQFFEKALRSYRSTIHINGHLSPPFRLHSSRKGPLFLLMYAQLSGSRRLIFSPAEDCAGTCSSFTVVVKSKDVVIFNKQFWTVISKAFEDDTSLSLSFMDEFDLI